MEQSHSWETNLFSARQKIPPHFLEPESSLRRLKVPATCPYPEPARSNPYNWNSLYSRAILYSHIQWGCGTHINGLIPYTLPRSHSQRISRDIMFPAETFNSRSHLAEICDLLGYYAALSGNSVQTFRDKLSVPSSRVKKSQKSSWLWR
jgi:hypothetical protein